MSWSMCTYCFAPNGELKALPSELARPLADPVTTAVFPGLSGETVRFADLIVEFKGQKPVRVLESSYYVLRFDNNGVPDASRLEGQWIATMRLAVDSMSLPEEADDGAATNAVSGEVLNRQEVFAAHGMTWTPSRYQERQLEAAALGRFRIERLVAILSS